MIFTKNRTTELLFIPKFQYLPCLVTKIRFFFIKVFLNYKILDINTSLYDHISKLPGITGFKFKKFVIFAHPNSAKTAIALNGFEDSSVLVRQFWQYRDISYGLLYAHICHGSIFLSDIQWREIFPRWVSHNDKVYMIIGNFKCNRYIRKLLLDIFKTVEQSQDHDSMHENLKLTYDKNFEKIVIKNFDYIDVPTLYTLMFIQNSLDTLVKI
jgi:hypothetical protein